MNLFVVIQLMLLFSAFRTSKGKHVELNSSLFFDVVRSDAFVDKTRLIKEIFNSRHHLITAPPRFGKSTNLDMMRLFLATPVDAEGRLDAEAAAAARRVFEQLAIYRTEPAFFEKHFLKHPVVYVSFKTESPITSRAEAMAFLKVRIHESYVMHSYVCKSEHLSAFNREMCYTWCDPENYPDISNAQTSKGLLTLAELLYGYFDGGKAFVLVDDFDSIAANAMLHVEDYYTAKGIIRFVAYLLCAAVYVSNPYIEWGVLTGVSHISGGRVARIDSIGKFKFLDKHPLVDYYGFTEAEVEALFKNPKFDLDDDTVEKARAWYDGYTSRAGRKIYSPFSVLNLLQTGKVDSYWAEHDPSDPLLLAGVTAIPEIRTRLLEMLDGRSMPIDLDKKTSRSEVLRLRNITQDVTPVEERDLNLYFTFLCEHGYLSFVDEGHVLLPNAEIKNELRLRLEKYRRA